MVESKVKDEGVAGEAEPYDACKAARQLPEDAKNQGTKAFEAARDTFDSIAPILEAGGQQRST